MEDAVLGAQERLPVSIVPYMTVRGMIRDGRRSETDAAIDQIFFASSSVQRFRDDEHRQGFRRLWLGRYLEEEPEHAFVAIRGSHVCGYLVGSLDDPAPRAEFDELDYFRAFAPQTARFPAHLHINVDAAERGQGVGAELIAAFEAHARAHGCAGVHVVTGAGMRNVGFYERLGFAEIARAPRNGSEVVMLAKAL